MLTTIQHSVAVASTPRGLGYSTWLTMRNATAAIAITAGTNGGLSRTIEMTVMAPIGHGIPWKTPGGIFTAEKRARRITTASTTAMAMPAETRWCAPSVT